MYALGFIVYRKVRYTSVRYKIYTVVVQICAEVQFHALKRTLGRKDIFYLTTHSTHFIYGYMAPYRTIQIAREETRCRHYMGYSFRLVAMGLLYAPPHRQDST